MFWYWIEWQAHAIPLSKYLFGGMTEDTIKFLLYTPDKNTANLGGRTGLGKNSSNLSLGEKEVQAKA